MKIRNKKKRICREVDRIAKQAGEVAIKINGLAEPPFKEYRSSRLIADFLEQHGFKVNFCFKNIPTAFKAECGRGRPRVGILGEYDALPNCGPEEGEMGHGCGHSLLGVGSAAGAIAAAGILKNSRITGKIVYYGCPAEETLAGKAYMARDGAFRELDACIAWHPSSDTAASYQGGSALDSVLYEFLGKTAHAANPVHGKSALDAAIIFDVAVNYLRETVPENVRIHSVIVDGGDAPNVVPAYAKSWYYIRAKDRAQVDKIRKLVNDCARGAAIATQTRYKSVRLTAIYDRLPNNAMFETIHENLKLFGSTPVTPADRKNLKKLGLEGDFNSKVNPAEKGSQGRASSDEDTVSRLTPLGRFNMTTHSKRTPGHHRLLAAQMSLPFAIRGMEQASKVIAGATMDIISSPERLNKIRKEFKQNTKGFKFDPLIPKRQSIFLNP